MMKLLQVSALAAALFGLEDVSDIKELDSYDDRNFYIKARNPRLSEGDDLVHGARFHMRCFNPSPSNSPPPTHPDPLHMLISNCRVRAEGAQRRRLAEERLFARAE